MRAISIRGRYKSGYFLREGVSEFKGGSVHDPQDRYEHLYKV